MQINNLFSGRNTQLLVGIIFILVVPTIAHILFSPLGFNPTDDGPILAGSRRIVDGQVPHRDFISIRPAGPHYLHIPFVLFGGEYTLWISRYFVWFQLAVIAWVWTLIISHLLKTFRSPIQKFIFALIAFFFSAHSFPIMAWHSIDALFIASIGILLCCTHAKSRTKKIVGYLLIGISPLFRQNFALLVPLSIILFNDWRKVRYWIIAGLPIALYVGYLAINGAVSDAILQLTTYSYKQTLGTGFITYLLNSSMSWGIVIGYVAAYMTHGKLHFEHTKIKNLWKKTKIQTNSKTSNWLGIILITIGLLINTWFVRLLFTASTVIQSQTDIYLTATGQAAVIILGLFLIIKGLSMIRIATKNTTPLRMIGILILFGIPLSVPLSIATIGLSPNFNQSFTIFGAVVGAMTFFIYTLYNEKKIKPFIQCGAIILIVAWSVSLSLGYNTPALALGPLVLFLIGCAISSGQLLEENKNIYKSKSSNIQKYFSRQHVRTYITILTILLLITTLITFSILRQNYIYRELPAAFLTREIDNVFPGGKLIKTNPNTYAFLKDLQIAKNIAIEKGKIFVIIPDVAAYWINSPQPNPLSIDWPQNTELGSPELVDRVTTDLEQQKGEIIVIVQKYGAYSLAEGFVNPVIRFWFIWDEVPGNDSIKFLQYVENKFKIDWVKNTDIKKSDDNNAITATDGVHSLALVRDNEKDTATLEIEGVRVLGGYLIEENSRLNFYRDTYSVVQYVHLNFNKTGETQLFELYE